MADPIQTKVDLSSMRAGLAQLAGPARESIARSMAVAGGQVIRDEAKNRASRGDGVLASAMYLAYKQARSTDSEQVYSISWNAKKAPHGHLVELGYWQPYVVVKTAKGDYITTNKLRPDGPKRIAAHPFLRPALDAAGPSAFKAMLTRGRQRMFDLLADPTSVDEHV
jgi:hypothetical protein